VDHGWSKGPFLTPVYGGCGLIDGWCQLGVVVSQVSRAITFKVLFVMFPRLLPLFFPS
jgi:hypothetical protein